MKRVFKTVEEMMGSLVENIKTHFLLNDKLAQYVTLSSIYQYFVKFSKFVQFHLVCVKMRQTMPNTSLYSPNFKLVSVENHLV